MKQSASFLFGAKKSAKKIQVSCKSGAFAKAHEKYSRKAPCFCKSSQLPCRCKFVETCTPGAPVI